MEHRLRGASDSLNHHRKLLNHQNVNLDIQAIFVNNLVKMETFMRMTFMLSD